MEPAALKVQLIFSTMSTKISSLRPPPVRLVSRMDLITPVGPRATPGINGSPMALCTHTEGFLPTQQPFQFFAPGSRQQIMWTDEMGGLREEVSMPSRGWLARAAGKLGREWAFESQGWALCAEAACTVENQRAPASARWAR